MSLCEPDLPARELAILRGLADGRPVTAIASSLYVSATTVKTTTRRMRQEFGARNTTNLVWLALVAGWLPEHEPERGAA